MGAPIAGEVVELTAVQPSAEEQKADAKGRIGNTGIQAGLPFSIMVIVGWILVDMAKIDLNGDAPGREMPNEVVAAFVAVFTVVVAWYMNREALRAVLTELGTLRAEKAYLRALAIEYGADEDEAGEVA